MAEMKRDERDPVDCPGDGPQPQPAGDYLQLRDPRTSELLRQIARCEDELMAAVAAGELFECAINAITQGIVIFDEQNLGIKYANESARSAIVDIEDQFKIKRGTLLGQPTDVLESLLSVQSADQTISPVHSFFEGLAGYAANPPLVIRALVDRQVVRRGLMLCWSVAKPERPLLM